MKKILCLLTLIALGLNSAFAAATATEKKDKNPSLFSYDEAKLNEELKDAKALEELVTKNNLTAAELQNTQILDVNKYEITSPNAPQFAMSDMDWAGFLWGFCCWPVGLIIYFANDKDSNYIISLLIGFVCAAVIGIVARIIYTAIYVTSTI